MIFKDFKCSYKYFVFCKLQDASSSTDVITQSSVNYLHKRKSEYSGDLLHS